MREFTRSCVEKNALGGTIMSALPVLMLLFSGAMKLVKAAPVVEGFAVSAIPRAWRSASE